MTKDKQIEEMALVLTDGGCKTCVGCSHNNRFQCKPIYDAELLYNAGYRKQSEGEWKQTVESLGWHDVDCVECSACGESWVIDGDFDFDLVKDFWNYCPNCGAKMKGGESDA